MFDNRPILNTLYVHRGVHYEDAQEIIKWAHSQGILTTLQEWDFYVTVVHSKTPFIWNEEEDRDLENLLIKGGQRSLEKFGEDGNVIVLRIESEALSKRHAELIEMGASHDYDDYRPHITLTYKGAGVDVSQIVPYTGDIRLGSEWWQPITGNPYSKGLEMNVPFQSFGKAQVLEVHKSLGLVVGFAIVSKVNGEDYYDFHGDHIPEDSMLKASIDFMKNSRVSGDMHKRDEDGTPEVDGEVVFAFPLTSDIAKSLDIETSKTGLLVGIMPSRDVLAKFDSGEYTGFSIGGRRIVDEDV